MLRCGVYACLLVGLLPASLLMGQESFQAKAPPLLPWVDAQFADLESHGIAAGACVIVRDGRIAHLAAYGVEDRDSNAPADPRATQFYLASVTKAFTATLIHRLVDQGKLDLDKDVAAYLGDEPTLTLLPTSGPVTLRHLLTHTAGFDDRNIGMAVSSVEQMESLSDYLTRALPPQVRPAGEVTMYDNHGWALAGLIAERVTGQSYFELLRREVFEPLGMRGSDVVMTEADLLRPHRAQAYATRYRGDEVVWKKVATSYRLTSPAGSIWATAEDVSRFLSMQLDGGEFDGAKYLSAESITAMQSTAWAPQAGADGLTAGFWERSIHGRRLLMIMGAGPEGASIVALAPSQNVGVFLAVSRRDLSYLIPILTEVLNRLASPKQNGSAAGVLPGWDQRAETLPGEYYLLRFSERNMETLAKWQAWLEVSVIGPGEIRTRDSLGDERTYREVSEFVFRQNGKPGLIAFKTIRAESEMFATTTDGFGFGDGMGFPNSFRKARWHERIRVKRSMLLISLLVFVLAVCLWPLVKAAGWAMRMLRQRNSESPTQKGRGAVVVWLAAVCGLSGILGVAALMADQDQLVLGTPGWANIPCWLILAFSFVLSPLSLVLTINAWRQSSWPMVDRLFATAVTVASVALIPFLWSWNLIAWAY